jgi:thiamine-monophosphate kinase
VYVSGSIGAAATGLQALRRQTESAAPDPDPAAAEREDCVRRYLYPDPRLRLGLLLGRNRAASACMDLSDGLADGLHQVARESGVGMIIDADLLPISPASRAWSTAQGTDLVTDALAGGDDYELIFTAKPRLRGRLKTVVRHSDVPITRIGVCTADRQVLIRRMVGGALRDTPAPKGFGHFA